MRAFPGKDGLEVIIEVLAFKKVKKETDQKIRTLQQKLLDMSSLDRRVSDLEGQMHEWNEVYNAIGGDYEERPQHQNQPSAAGPSKSPAELQKLNYMSKTKIFEGHTASVFRLWQEWSNEFLQRVVLVDLPEELYYLAASVELAHTDSVRPVRNLGYLKLSAIREAETSNIAIATRVAD